MKAVVVHQPGNATLADIPEPSTDSGEALLQVRNTFVPQGWEATP